MERCSLCGNPEPSFYGMHKYRCIKCHAMINVCSRCDPHNCPNCGCENVMRVR